MKHPFRIQARIMAEFERQVREGDAPNMIRVFLHPRDYAHLAPEIPSLRASLLQLLDERARTLGYRTVGRRTLHFTADPTVALDSERIVAGFTYEPQPRPEPETTAGDGTLTMLSPELDPPTETEEQKVDVPASTPVNERAGGVPDLAFRLPGGEQVPVLQVPFSIGRVPGNDLVLASFAVSRYHAEITRDDDGLVLRDMGSRNGIIMDGERHEKVRVRPGAVVTIGDVDLRVEAGEV